MSRKFSLFAAITTLVLFIAGFGFLSQDPYGSKTLTSSDNNQVQTQQQVPSFTPPVYTDDMDGANDTTALKSRGYKVWYRGGGPQGTTATWFQGNSAVFPSFNGPSTGYVAANYNVVTGANNIDSWLVLPYMSGGLQVGDSLYFYSRAPSASTFPDSIRVMVSVSDSVPEGTWVELGRFKVNTSNLWERRGFRSTVAGTHSRFAIRYNVVNGGPSGNNSDYIGIDAITIIRTGGGPSLCNYYSSQWCALSAFPSLPSATYFSAADWQGDTLYVHTPSTTGAAATTINRYKYGGSWSTGVPLPVAKTGGTLTECNGKLYYIGGGSSVTVGSTDVYEYNPSTGTWLTRAPMPAALSAHGAVNWGDSVIFIVGGPYSGAGTNLAVHYYRVGSNTWGTIANSLPSGQGRRTFAIGITAGNKIVISCGFNTAYLNSTYVGTIGANASLITWVAAPNAPIALSRPAGASYGNYFYLVGGDTNTTAVKNTKVFVFNSVANSWFYTILNNPNAVSNIFSGVTAHCINDTVRVFQPGGYTTVATANFVVLGCGPTITGNSTIKSTTPSSYSLSQNYPNPFNPMTKISFSLPKNSDVKLVVFDILGKEVKTLVNDYRTAGTHQVEFNASDLASGVYLYRIEAGDFKDVKRMVLIK